MAGFDQSTKYSERFISYRGLMCEHSEYFITQLILIDEGFFNGKHLFEDFSQCTAKILSQ